MLTIVLDCRPTGSYPETGFWEVTGRLVGNTLLNLVPSRLPVMLNKRSTGGSRVPSSSFRSHGVPEYLEASGVNDSIHSEIRAGLCGYVNYL